MILFYWGDTYIPVKDMTMGMKFNTEAKQYGFKDGDILVGTDKGTFKDFSADLFRDISEAKRVDIIRDGKAMSLQLPGDINLLGMLKAEPPFVSPYIPAEIDSVMDASPAAKIGLKKGDKIVALNGKPIDSYNEFTNQIGILSDMMTDAKTTADSMKLRAGIKYGWNVLAGYVGDMKYVFTADGAKSLGGFGAIGSLFPPMWDWYMFWKMTAFLSIILAFMNILPIPALDGGHVLFLFYEMITRRKPSETFMIRAEYVGFGILILLMVVANLNDILRWLGYL